MTVEPVGLVIALSASSLVWLIATRWLAVIVLSLLEPDDTPRSRDVLVVGRLPGRAETQHLAYLRGGRGRVAEVMTAQAVADGWLLESAEKKGSFEVFDPRDDASPDAALLKRHLGHQPDVAKVHAAAKEAASVRSSAIAADLERSGMRRPIAHHAIAVAAGMFSAAAFTFAVSEFWDMASGNAFAERFVLGAAAAFALAMIGVLATLPRKTSRAEAYEAWFVDATPGIQEAAADGSLTNPRDVGLAAAGFGLATLTGKRFRALSSPVEP